MSTEFSWRLLFRIFLSLIFFPLGVILFWVNEKNSLIKKYLVIYFFLNILTLIFLVEGNDFFKVISYLNCLNALFLLTIYGFRVSKLKKWEIFLLYFFSFVFLAYEVVNILFAFLSEKSYLVIGFDKTTKVSVGSGFFVELIIIKIIIIIIMGLFFKNYKG